MKKKIIILLIILIIGSLILLILRKKKSALPPSTIPSVLTRPTVTQRPFSEPTGEKMEINGVKINNLYKNPLKENRQYDVVIVKNDKYQIVYLQQFQQFLISILDPDFDTVKSAAEKDFVEKLGITNNDACKLQVNISTPRYVNADIAGTTYPLSFCSKTP